MPLKVKNKITLRERAKIKAEIRAEAKKKKLQRMDGLGPYEKKKIREALRQVWHRSQARKLVVNRCLGKDGFPKCEECKHRTATLKIDHINPIGEVDQGFIERLFVPSSQLQGLCKACHQPKTNKENAKRRASKKKVKDEIGDFY